MALALTFGYSQNWTSIDSFAQNLQWSGQNVQQLSHQLTKNYIGETEKNRAIFSWIGAHITYDCDAFFDPLASQRSISYRNQKDYKQKVKQWENQQVQQVLQSRKGMCMNYTLLYRDLCRAAGLEAEVVPGRIKTGRSDIGAAFVSSNHAWVAVKIEGQWTMHDPTLASGFVKKDCSGFVPEFRDEYYMIPPEQLILTHCPMERKWQLLEKPVSRRRFMAMPYASNGIHHFGVESVFPTMGILQASDTQFAFAVRLESKIARVQIYEDDLAITPPITMVGNLMKFSHQRQNPKAKNLSIYFETDEKSYLIARYRYE